MKKVLLVLCLLSLLSLSSSVSAQQNVELGYYFPYMLEEGETYSLSISEDEQREIEILSNERDVAEVRIGDSAYEIESVNAIYKDYAREGTITPIWRGQKVVEKTDANVVLMGKCGSNGFFFNRVGRELGYELSDEPKPEAFKLKVSTEESPYPKCTDAFDMFAGSKSDGVIESSEKIFINSEVPISSSVSHSIDPDLDGKFEDVNGDRDLNSEDVRAFSENIGNLALDEFDFNRDGDVTQADISRLRELSDLGYEGIKRSTSREIEFEPESNSKLVRVRMGSEIKMFNVSLEPELKSHKRNENGYRLVINGTWYQKIERDGSVDDTSFFRIGEVYGAKVEEIYKNSISSPSTKVKISPLEELDAEEFPEVRLEKLYTSNIGYPSKVQKFRIGDEVIDISFSSSDIDSAVLINGDRVFEPCQEESGVFEGYDDRMYNIGEYNVRFEEDCDFSSAFPRERLRIDVAKSEDIHSSSFKGVKSINHGDEMLLKEGWSYEFTSDSSINVNTPEISVKSIDKDEVVLRYRGFRSIVQSRIECRFKGEMTLSDGDILDMQKKIGRGEDLLYRVSIQNTGEAIHTARFEPVSEPSQGSETVNPPESGCGSDEEQERDRANRVFEDLEFPLVFGVAKTQINQEPGNTDLKIILEPKYPNANEWHDRMIIKRVQENGETRKTTNNPEKPTEFLGITVEVCNMDKSSIEAADVAVTRGSDKEPCVETGLESRIEPKIEFGIDLDFGEGSDTGEELNIGETVAVTTNNDNIPSDATFNGEVIGPNGNTIAEENRTFSFEGIRAGEHEVKMTVKNNENSKTKTKTITFSEESETIENQDKNRITLQTDNPRTGVQIQLQINTKQQITQNGYKIIVANPKKETIVEKQNQETITFTPGLVGEYTAKIYPTGTIQSILNSITGPLKTKTFEVSSVQPQWINYCRTRDYNTNSIQEKINCIKQEIVPNYFEDSTGETPEVAESLCLDLLGYSYSNRENSCIS